jgi:hypothetical protein
MGTDNKGTERIRIPARALTPQECDFVLSDGTNVSGTWMFSTGPGNTTPTEDNIRFSYCGPRFEAVWDNGSQIGTVESEGTVELDGFVWAKTRTTTTSSTGGGPPVGFVELVLTRLDTTTDPWTGYVVDNYTGEGGYPATTVYDHDGSKGEPLTAEGFGLLYFFKL